ncbi:MAG: hypothetical protein KAV00_05715, partial [Phycisphaerae bacterium]|nr:hypothetical protein [Phycisphaerae bacterium]
ICAAVLICVCMIGRSGPSDKPAPTTGPSATTARDFGELSRAADKLKAFIRAVAEADDPRSAMSAYARGCSIDRNSAALQNAYMERMLKFGLPKIAYHPARLLVRIDPNNGLAWGVVGYMHGKRGELDKAFAATMRSLEKHRDDPSVLHNAGQLAAWYDSTINRPKVSDRARRTLSKIKKELAGKKPYSSAYEAIKSACARQASLMKQLDKKVAVIEAEVLPVRKAGMELDSQVREINDEIDRCKRIIDGLWREVRTGVVYRDVDGRLVYRRHSRWYRDDLYDRINREEQALARFKSERRRIRNRSNALLVELKDKEAQLNRLKRQMRGLKGGTDRIFRWDPPAVDGVFTPEAEHFPISTRPAAPRDPETQASQRLKLARLYLRHKMNDKAVVILEGILEDYPATKAAKEAKILLVKLKPVE